MANPSAHLPPALTSEPITALLLSHNLPPPTHIEPLKVTAEFHSIYLVHLPPNAPTSHPSLAPLRPNPDGTLTLVLRVSGTHLPRLKTRNEVGVIAWLRAHTTIPVPAVVAHDASTANPLAHEFTLLERAAGVSVDSIYAALPEPAKRSLVRQLVAFLEQLSAQPWAGGCVGGLVVGEDGEVSPGPLVEETLWMAPEVERYWGAGESVFSLNALAGAFPSYTAACTACIERYIHAIQTHPALAPYRTMVPRLETFTAALQDEATAAEINSVKYLLAHRDLHFANTMCDPSSPDCRITAVLDWEFAGVVPAPRWNPARAFLWSGRRSEAATAEQARLEGVFRDVCRERGAEYLLEEGTAVAGGRQEAMQTVVSYVRAIVEVVPKGEKLEKAVEWRGVAEKAMEVFGV